MERYWLSKALIVASLFCCHACGNVHIPNAETMVSKEAMKELVVAACQPFAELSGVIFVLPESGCDGCISETTVLSDSSLIAGMPVMVLHVNAVSSKKVRLHYEEHNIRSGFCFTSIDAIGRIVVDYECQYPYILVQLNNQNYQVFKISPTDSNAIGRVRLAISNLSIH